MFLGPLAPHASNPPHLLGVILGLTELVLLWPHRMVIILALLHGTNVVPASQEEDLPGVCDNVWVLDPEGCK